MRDLRNATSRKEKVLRRAAILLDEYKFSLEQAYFKSEKRTLAPSNKPTADHGVSAAGPAAAAGGGGGDANRRRSSVLSAIAAGGPVNNEVVEIIAQNDGMKSALKRLGDVLFPFLNDETNDVSYTIVSCDYFLLLTLQFTPSLSGGGVRRTRTSACRTRAPHVSAA